ncbi:lipoate--protein ligase, partial [Bacillus sp. SA1-12]
VQKGVIENCKIYGDFFGVGDVKEVEQALIGTRYDKSELERMLQEIDVKAYFGNIEKTDFLQLIY